MTTEDLAKNKRAFINAIECRMLHAELSTAEMFQAGRWSKLTHHGDRLIKGIRKGVEARLAALGDP